MSKKFDISPKEFSLLLSSLSMKPNINLIKRIDSKMFPLDNNKVFNFKPERLAYIEFSNCLSLYKKRNPDSSLEDAMLRLNGIKNLIIKEEEKYREQLEQLAIHTIKEIYQVPNYLQLKGMIYPRLNLDIDQYHEKKTFTELSLEQRNLMLDEINKRMILNSLVHGSSCHIWKGIYHLVSEELGKINPALVELYDYYTSTLGILIWMMNPDSFGENLSEADVVQGFNKLNFNKTFGGQVDAKGICFPVLLHELNKGVMDWLISAAIPKEYSEQQLEYYYAKADNYNYEIYHYLLGPALWSELLDTTEIENEKIPHLISKLTKLSYQELASIFRLILSDKETAKKEIKKWKLK